MADNEEGTLSGGYARGRVPSGAVSLGGAVDEYKTGTKAAVVVVVVVAANVHNNYVGNFRMELKCEKREGRDVLGKPRRRRNGIHCNKRSARVYRADGT